MEQHLGNYKRLKSELKGSEQTGLVRKRGSWESAESTRAVKGLLAEKTRARGLKAERRSRGRCLLPLSWSRGLKGGSSQGAYTLTSHCHEAGSPQEPGEAPCGNAMSSHWEEQGCAQKEGLGWLSWWRDRGQLKESRSGGKQQDGENRAGFLKIACMELMWTMLWDFWFGTFAVWLG